MNTASIFILLAMVIYLVGMLIVGFRLAKENESESDFYLGGRRLGPLVTAMSAEASDMSGYLLMGLPGLAYLSGIAHVGWTTIGLAIGTYLNWLLTAKRLRRYTQITDSFTLPQFFSKRFHDDRNILNAISAIIIIIFFIPYTASGFAACGKLFTSLFGLPYVPTMIISAVVIVGYTTAGGFLAASITDFIQSIIMTFAIIFILIFATISAGGIDAVIDNAKSLPGYLSMTSTYVSDINAKEPYSLLQIVSTLAWGLGYFGMPHILLRFMAIEDTEKLTLSRRVASIWVVIAMGMAVLIGLIGRTLSEIVIIEYLGGSATETVIVRISNFLSTYGALPAFVAGIILSGILASTMSTADSQLLAAASSVSQNILQESLHIKISKTYSMLIARLTVIIISILGVIIARDPDSSVFGIVSFAWAGFGACFGPLVILALYWKRTNLYGSIAGLISGGIMIFVWKYLIAPLGGAWSIYELLPAFATSLVITIIVSLVTAPPSSDILDEFDRAADLSRSI